jgi:hypothetical protein
MAPFASFQVSRAGRLEERVLARLATVAWFITACSRVNGAFHAVKQRTIRHPGYSKFHAAFARTSRSCGVRLQWALLKYSKVLHGQTVSAMARILGIHTMPKLITS